MPVYGGLARAGKNKMQQKRDTTEKKQKTDPHGILSRPFKFSLSLFLSFEFLTFVVFLSGTFFDFFSFVFLSCFFLSYLMVLCFFCLLFFYSLLGTNIKEKKKKLSGRAKRRQQFNTREEVHKNSKKNQPKPADLQKGRTVYVKKKKKFNFVSLLLLPSSVFFPFCFFSSLVFFFFSFSPFSLLSLFS